MEIAQSDFERYVKQSARVETLHRLFIMEDEGKKYDSIHLDMIAAVFCWEREGEDHVPD